MASSRSEMECVDHDQVEGEGTTVLADVTHEEDLPDETKEPKEEAVVITPKPGEIEMLVKVDRRKLEEMILTNNGGKKEAQVFFDGIMKKSGTLVLWPTKLKIGAKSKKDPNVKVIGLPLDVSRAKELILTELDTKSMRVTLKIDIPHIEHSHIIGVGGKTVKRISEETNCHIHFPDSNRLSGSYREKSNQVSINGPIGSVEVTRVRIRNLLPINLTCEIPLQGEFDAQAPALHQFMETYGVSINAKYAQPSSQGYSSPYPMGVVSCIIEGTEENMEGLKSVIIKLHEYYGCHVNPTGIMVVLMMIVPTQHHQMVLSQGNLRRIMDQTSSRIQVDQRSRNGLTKVSIQGTVTNVLQCRLQLIGCFPLVLMFDIGDGNQEIDSDKLDRFLADLKQKYDVFASVKSKPKQYTKSVLVKSLEQNAPCIYESRSLILDFVEQQATRESPPLESSLAATSLKKENVSIATEDSQTRSNSRTDQISNDSSKSSTPIPTSNMENETKKPQEAVLQPSILKSSKLTSSRSPSPGRSSSGSRVGFEMSPRVFKEYEEKKSVKEYEEKKKEAEKAMQQSIDPRRTRYPTTQYCGDGFSHSMPTRELRHNLYGMKQDPHLSVDPRRGSQNVPKGLTSLSQSTLKGLLDTQQHQSQEPHPPAYHLSQVHDISSLLKELQLESYESKFTDQEIDLDIFLTMSEGDLAEIGINKLGPKRKLRMAINDLKSLRGYKPTV